MPLVWAAVLLGVGADPKADVVHPQHYLNGKGSGPLAWTFRLLLEERHIQKGNLFLGTVTELTGDTIAIRGWSGRPRTFAVSIPVASKDLPLTEDYRWKHRLGQVRVGDTVDVLLAPTWRGPVVVALGIYRRPGGLIPVAEDEHLPEDCRAHINLNLRQARKDVVMPKLGRMFAHVHR
jgi:hypothetical protein